MHGITEYTHLFAVRTDTFTFFLHMEPKILQQKYRTRSGITARLDGSVTNTIRQELDRFSQKFRDLIGDWFEGVLVNLVSVRTTQM